MSKKLSTFNNGLGINAYKAPVSLFANANSDTGNLVK